jgi:predicted dehydrogenase
MEERLRGDWRKIKGNFGPPGKRMDLAGIEKHADAYAMLSSDAIDTDDICLPPALHADVAIAALNAGKLVFCEKPIALHVDDAQRMAKAAAKNKRLLMIGHVLPFFPEYDWARKTIRGGEFGALRGGAFRRVIADPTWLANYWSADHVGGPMLDLHVHDAHFIRLVFGMPREVTTCGRRKNNLPEFWHSHFRFADANLVVEATSGTIDQQGRPFTHAFEIHLEKATLAFDFAVIGGAGRYLCEPMLFDSNGNVQKPDLDGGEPINAFVSELREVAHSIRDGKTSEILGAILAQDAMRLCEAQAASMQSGKPVTLAT